MTIAIEPDAPLARDFSSILAQMGDIVGNVNTANGWDSLRNPVVHTYDLIASLALVMTEASEAIEEVRAGRGMNERYYSYKPVPPSLAVEFTNGHDAKAHWESTQNPKPEGVPSELADVLIRVLDIADAFGIDLGAAVVEKINYNANRGVRHGGKKL